MLLGTLYSIISHNFTKEIMQLSDKVLFPLFGNWFLEKWEFDIFFGNILQLWEATKWGRLPLQVKSWSVLKSSWTKFSPPYFRYIKLVLFDTQILGQICVKSWKWPFWVHKITTVSRILKKAKNAKVGIFLIISYIRNTGKIMKIEKIISFHTMKTVVIFGDFFAIFDPFRWNVIKM